MAGEMSYSDEQIIWFGGNWSKTSGKQLKREQLF